MPTTPCPIPLRGRFRPKGPGYIFIFAVFLLFFFGLPSASRAATFTEVYKREQFLLQSLLQAVAADVTGDGRDELLLSGRNYESREAYVFLMRWNGSGLETLWRSDNLWEPTSHIAMAAGDFTGQGRDELVVLTEETLRLFVWQDGDMVLTHQQSGLGAPAEIGAVHHPHHENELIAVTRRHGVSADIPEKGVELIGWFGGAFRPLWQTPTIGRVRALAAGTLQGERGADLVVEVGERMGAGNVEVWSWTGDGYERTFQSALRPAPAFGLDTTDDGELLITADDRGRVSVFRWPGAADEGLTLLGESTSLGWAVASAAAGDFFGDGGRQIVVIGYPNRLHVVQVSL